MQRELQPEAMDDPSLEAGRHRRALRGLSRLNRLSGSVRIVWPSIRALARREKRRLRILDLAGTRVTDAGVSGLARLGRLKAINLESTHVTAAGAAELKRQLPGCEVEGSA